MADIHKETLFKHFSKRLKELRKAKGVTQQDVLNDTGILISGIEQGKRDVSISTLSKLCAYFGLTLSDFFGDYF
jgi:transcriptional regulator with XRE-family HTH domain